MQINQVFKIYVIIIYRCPTYNNLPSNRCYVQKIDGKCCSEPRCLLPNNQTVNPLITQTGYGIIPTKNGGYIKFRPDHNYTSSGYYTLNSFNNTRKECIYKGQVYSQGQEWNDGCNFNCRCTNGEKGQFVCNRRYVICQCTYGV
ncbi:hypothetical protein KUTeg_019197 [Tegillarca granosa]|uniref:Uncharacterized protein n=1 Tax=Tegillarca granosa TaxID=220873 RepID=A0ABQ9EG29_TEGGR|nr:hypothetical protein KUTeg_019197 [Tegillarca granosa]